jgi:hypothetical protein
MRRVRKELGTITCPSLTIHDVNDRIIPSRYLKIIEREQMSREIWKVWRPKMGNFNHGRHYLLSSPTNSIQAITYDSIFGIFTRTKEKAMLNAKTTSAGTIFHGGAVLSSLRSKDPTPRGEPASSAVIMIVGVGYNGLSLGVNDDEVPWELKGTAG